MTPNDAPRNHESSTGERIALGFGNLSASLGDHIGHFYQTNEEWRAILIPFLKAGLVAGHKCVYLMSPDHGQREIEEALAEEGVEVEEAFASGQIVMAEGRTTPEEMLDGLNDAIGDANGSYPIVRWSGDMTWSLKKMPNSETLMEWETMCNLIKGPPAVFLCQYDLTQFSGDVVIDAFKTHPLCIIGSTIHQNPFYEDPGVFLEKLRSRKGG